MHTPSQFVADEVVLHFGADPGRVRAVHHGIPRADDSADHADHPDHDDHPDHGPARCEGQLLGRPPLQLPDGCERYVVAVGTIEPRKDYPLLVSAFNQMAADYPGVALVIIGGRGWGSKALDDAVAASPVASRVLRPGYVDAPIVDAAIAGAALLAFPSVYEGFGFPPLQAMSMGVPVVATASGAVPEVVADGAALVEPGDADALAKSMAALLDGGVDVETLVDRGLRRSRDFTWERCAEGLVALYRDALDDAGTGRL